MKSFFHALLSTVLVMTARLAALTDEEATALASSIDRLPAGAGGSDPLPYILIGGGLVLFAKAAKNHNAAQGS